MDGIGKTPDKETITPYWTIIPYWKNEANKELNKKTKILVDKRSPILKNIPQVLANFL